MNDLFRELKARMRKLDDVLSREGGGVANVEFAQALSQLHRAARHGDRSRAPSAELQALLARAEGLASKIA